MLISLKDRTTGKFAPPLLVATVEEAKRSLIMCFLNGEKSMITQFPNQYDLYKVGDFDLCQGILTPINPEFLMNGMTAKLEAIENIKNSQVDMSTGTITSSLSGDEEKGEC